MRLLLAFLFGLILPSISSTSYAVADAGCPWTVTTCGSGSQEYDATPGSSWARSASEAHTGRWTAPANSDRRQITSARVGSVSVSGFVVAAKTGLPQLSAGRSALQAKFKHASDFGITESRGSAGFDAYGKAVDSFVQASSTTRMLGTYRGNAAILNYNARTAQVVVQAPDGAFISGWQMSPAQLQNVIARGSLGGG